MKSISVQELSALLGGSNPVDVIDVRQRSEYRRGHVPAAVLIPLGQVTVPSVQAVRKAAGDEPVYVICQSGGRSRAACSQLTAAGMNNVVNVEGGTSAWIRAGLPTESEPGGGLPNWVRAVGFVAIIALIVLGLTLKPIFLYFAPVIWIGMIIAGGGACPLVCSLRPPPRS